MAVVGRSYAIGPTRVQFQEKDPRGWKEFETQLCEHSTLGSANTMRGVQARRPSLYDLAESMRSLTVPTLIVNGDEDEPCLDVGNFMKRTNPAAALAMLPKRSEEHTSELQSLMRISYAALCLKKTRNRQHHNTIKRNTQRKT